MNTWANRPWAVAFLLVALVAPNLAWADVYVRVVDVGAGECCVIALPDDKYIVYDAGNFEDKGRTAIQAIEEIVGPSGEIELLILSHSDADHYAAVPQICDKYRVKRVIRDGFERESQTWTDALDAIHREVQDDGCEDLNLADADIQPGREFTFGEATVQFICGFFELPADWPALSDSEAINARSIVVRLEYAGHSVLFCGDTVGRHSDDDDDVCIAAERFMVDNISQVSIQSDVIIAPHHGADNGSSSTFIAAVNPSYVVFSAGHKHQHPRRATAQRYLDHGVSLTRMLRTDRGDNEGGKEWRAKPPRAVDPRGDDDVEIFLPSAGPLRVRYKPPPQNVARDAPSPAISRRDSAPTNRVARRGLFRRLFRR